MNALIALVLLATPMTLSVQEHYSAALKAYETENWKRARAPSRCRLQKLHDDPFC